MSRALSGGAHARRRHRAHPARPPLQAKYKEHEYGCWFSSACERPEDLYCTSTLKSSGSCEVRAAGHRATVTGVL